MWLDAFHIITDFGHFIAEIFFEIVFLVLGLIGNYIMMKYRDRKHGHKE
jgi:hypothetical protein